MSESRPRARHALQFKLEALKLVKGGQVAAVTAKILSVPKQTLDNWVRLAHKGQLKGAGDKPVRCGRATSPVSRPTRVGCTWPWL